MYSQVAKLIKESREAKGLSQKDVSERLGFTSPQMISNIERGLCGFPVSRGRKLCRLLDIDFERDLLEATFADTKARIIAQSKRRAA